MSKLVAHQGDLFADAKYWAELEQKFPHLRAIEGAASNGARPQRSEDAAPGDAVASLGNTIRNRLSADEKTARRVEVQAKLNLREKYGIDPDMPGWVGLVRYEAKRLAAEAGGA